MSGGDKIERSIRQMCVATRAVTDERILADSFAALEGIVSGRSSRVSDRSVRLGLRSPIVELGAVAAVVMLGVALFSGRFSGPSVVSFQQVAEKLLKLDNLCVTTYLPDQTEPQQQWWIARNLNFNIYRSINETILWDVGSKTKRVKYESSGYTSHEQISDEALADVEDRLADICGLIPFADSYYLPANARWTRVSDSELSTVVPGLEVYDLTWATDFEVKEQHKWRYFVDSETDLPERVELYIKRGSEPDYRLSEYLTVSFPDAGQVLSLIEDVFVSPDDSIESSSPEYISTPGSP